MATKISTPRKIIGKEPSTKPSKSHIKNAVPATAADIYRLVNKELNSTVSKKYE